MIESNSSLSALGKRWIHATATPESLELARRLNLHPQVASLLWQRGHRSAQHVRAFLEPKLQSLGDPFLLTDLRRAAERIMAAIAARERIVIFGDYDVDGITSSALLWRVLRKLGATVETFLPLRMEEGYGLSQDGVERCVEQHRPKLLVAVDCGTTAIDQVAWLCARSGIDTVIIDHHALAAATSKRHVALVNPQRDLARQGPGSGPASAPSDYFASVGLVFKVLPRFAQARRGGKPAPSIFGEYLDLVALGTVADIVPLVEENRVLVRRGLRQMEQSRWAGVQELVPTPPVRRLRLAAGCLCAGVLLVCAERCSLQALTWRSSTALFGQALAVNPQSWAACNNLALVALDDVREVFTGDTFGVSYRECDTAAGEFVFPTTSPAQFDPAQLHASISRIEALKPAGAYLTHYGRVGSVERLAADLHADIDVFVRIAQDASTAKDRVPQMRVEMYRHLSQRLAVHGFAGDDEAQHDMLDGDVVLNTAGLDAWLTRIAH